jgi:undecaprenyl diphosphate synthase
MLMRLFRRYLLSEVDRCAKNGVRMTVIGRRDRLPVELCKAIETAELATRGGTRLDLRIALDYSARESILRAAQFVDGRSMGPETFAQVLNSVTNAGPSRDVDLLIRTGGEQRLSDFLLWECAYAELYFTKRMWPEFSPADLYAAVREFHARDRRFGGISEAAAVAG